MLRKLRIILGCICFICITLLFIGIGEQWWGWMAKLQFLPSALALNFATVVGILLLTFVFGRIYCSVICPMGVFQDSINWLSSLRKGKKRRFRFTPEKKWLRWSVLALTVLAIVFGIQVFVAIIAPYSAYGRIVRSIVAHDNITLVAVAAVTLIVIFILAWIGGRTYCNTICPVGTTLGLFSRFSLFKISIDESKCVECHGCEKACKASCIDSNTRTIDYSRCVDCFDCIKNCKVGAISYRFAPSLCRKAGKEEEKSVDTGKRAFLGGILLAGAGLTKAHAQSMEFDGGMVKIADKKTPARSSRIVPFGAKSQKNFYDHCTACQLCVSACPNNVLRPSTDLEHLMQPQMGYENGYCRPECTQCSQICPSGAILPITPEEKTMIHIGTASVNRELCFGCGNCERHCPTGAIMMVRSNPIDPASPMIPAVDGAKCIGCGACEYLCPVRPYSAIYVNGLEDHIS